MIKKIHEYSETHFVRTPGVANYVSGLGHSGSQPFNCCSALKLLSLDAYIQDCQVSMRNTEICFVTPQDMHCYH